MKSFQAVILAAIVASSAAVNEPVASPTAAIDRELANYERQLVTGTPTTFPGRPTATDTPTDDPTPDLVSLQYICIILSCEKLRWWLNDYG